jgi:hypothetical protein
MKRTYKLIAVLRPQPEFSTRREGENFEVESDRLVALPDGKWSLPNPAAATVPGYMGPKSIAIFEKVS